MLPINLTIAKTYTMRSDANTTCLTTPRITRLHRVWVSCRIHLVLTLSVTSVSIISSLSYLGSDIFISSPYLCEPYETYRPASCSCLVELPDFSIYGSLRAILGKFLFYSNFIIVLSCPSHFDFKATATASGITGSSSPRSSTTGSTEVTDTVSSSPSSSGSGTQSDSAIGFKFPPAFYAVGLALMAGVALVL